MTGAPVHDPALEKAIAVVVEARAREARPCVKAFFDEPTFTASYVVHDPATRRAAIIDSVLDFDAAAGRTSHVSAQAIVDYIKSENLTIDWLIETHAHADHLSAAPWLQQQLGGAHVGHAARSRPVDERVELRIVVQQAQEAGLAGTEPAQTHGPAGVRPDLDLGVGPTEHTQAGAQAHGDPSSRRLSMPRRLSRRHSRACASSTGHLGGVLRCRRSWDPLAFCGCNRHGTQCVNPR